MAQRDRREDSLMPSLMSFYKERLSAEGINLLCSNVWGKNTGNLASDMTEGTCKEVVRTIVKENVSSTKDPNT